MRKDTAKAVKSKKLNRKPFFEVGDDITMFTDPRTGKTYVKTMSGRFMELDEDMEVTIDPVTGKMFVRTKSGTLKELMCEMETIIDPITGKKIVRPKGGVGLGFELYVDPETGKAYLRPRDEKEEKLLRDLVMLVRPGLGFYDVDPEDIFVDMSSDDYKVEYSEMSWTDQLNSIGQKNKEEEDAGKMEEMKQMEEMAQKIRENKSKGRKVGRKAALKPEKTKAKELTPSLKGALKTETKEKGLAKAGEKVVRIIALPTSKEKTSTTSLKRERDKPEAGKVERSKSVVSIADSIQTANTSTDQPVISVTITEKKVPGDKERKISSQSEKFRKSDKPSKLVKQQSTSNMTPFAQSLVGKLSGLHAVEIHEKVKVDAEIKSRMTKAFRTAKVLESLADLKQSKESEIPPITVIHEDDHNDKKPTGKLPDGKLSPGKPKKSSVSPQLQRKTGQFLAPPGFEKKPAKGAQKSGKCARKKSKLTVGSDKSDSEEETKDGSTNDQSAETKVDWRKMNPDLLDDIDLEKLTPAERRRVEVLRKRRQKELEKKQQEEEEKKMAEAKLRAEISKQIMEDRIREAEEQKRKDEEAARVAELEARRKAEEARNRERQKRLEEQKMKEKLKQEKLEQEAQAAALAAQREAEEARKLREEEEKMAKMAKIERERYEQLKREQEEVERLRKEEEERKEREEMQRVLEESERLAKEAKRRQAENEAKALFNKSLRMEQNFLERNQEISRAFVYSYFELMRIMENLEDDEED